tara:strand:- start:838 stop:1656 length:819 start_codon:yes stop_codon:yes gene_type:complete
MELKDKLFGIPRVYYFNKDSDDFKNEHMDRCLSNLDIDYDRISTSKYTQENVSEWKHLLSNKNNYKLPVGVAGYSITVLEFLKDWLNTTDDNQLVIMRDTVDFDLCSTTLQYNWDFDWKYMMTRLPYDWDCFQFGFENVHYIPFYLHQIMPASTFGPSLLNRRYVKKLVRLHCKEDKYDLTGNIANLNFGLKSGTIDYFIGHNGKTYCIPLFPSDPKFYPRESKKFKMVRACKIAYHDWWSNDARKYSLDEIFTYGKGNDISMVRKTMNYYA